MNDCIFCKIIRRELPCTQVYETDAAMAFLDIAPVAPGHILVIPRKHVERITDVPDDLLAPLLSAVRAMAAALTDRLGADGVSLTQANGECAGQVVPHLHFHLIPRYNDHPLRWTPGRYADADEMRRIAAKIAG